MILNLDYLLQIRPELELPYGIATCFEYHFEISFKKEQDNKDYKSELYAIQSTVSPNNGRFCPMHVKIEKLTPKEKWFAYSLQRVNQIRNKFDLEERRLLQKVEIDPKSYCPIDDKSEKEIINQIRAHDYDFDQINKLKRLATVINIYNNCEKPQISIPNKEVFIMQVSSVKAASALISKHNFTRCLD